MCPHACCRGYRVHPENYPTVLPSRLLRRASDDDLAKHFVKVSEGHTAADAEARDQVIYEMTRRDEVEARRRDRWAAHREAVAAGRAARRMEREAETERVYLAAEAYTRGNWVNRSGGRAGISDREILTGPQRVFDRYASEEAREFFSSQPRPTARFFTRQSAQAVGGASWWR
jgi:hypothetical protein